jgi:hypothetical protein
MGIVHTVAALRQTAAVRATIREGDAVVIATGAPRYANLSITQTGSADITVAKVVAAIGVLNTALIEPGADAGRLADATDAIVTEAVAVPFTASAVWGTVVWRADIADAVASRQRAIGRTAARLGAANT